MELTRKCKICGKNIFIDRDRSTFFYDKTGFCHKDCFVEKKKNQKRPWTDDLLMAFFDKVKDTTDKKVDDILSKKREQDHSISLCAPPALCLKIFCGQRYGKLRFQFRQ